MSELSRRTGEARYAWREVEPQGPPKRSATDRIADFLEVYGRLDAATARDQASRCLQCPEPTCVRGCPLGNRIPEWMALTAEGHFLEAAAVAHACSNFPEICARTCPRERTCESLCLLNGQTEPVAIGAIEQFISDYALAHGGVEVETLPWNGLRVAVLGSSPGGLTCADELARRGYAVTVFDQQLLPGGLLVNGIPAFRLDRSVVHQRVAWLQKRGVTFRVGSQVSGEISLCRLRADFDAVFLGFGAQQSRSLDIPGADLEGVVQAVPFIIQQNTHLSLDLPPIDVKGQRVLVIGAGDMALDTVRTAIRAGAREATVVYRRDEASMPCSPTEYANAIEEGARFVFQAAPVQALAGERGRVRGLQLVRTELGTRDASGRPAIRVRPGTEFDLPAEWVFTALGFDPAPPAANSDLGGLAVDPDGRFKVDERQMTSLAGVFAGGDVVRGPSMVVEAVRDARKAAEGIHDFLRDRIRAADRVPSEPVPAR